jgi:hypothetical protein
MPAEAAAKIEHTLITKIRKQRAKSGSFMRVIEPTNRTRRLAVLSEELRFIVFILLHDRREIGRLKSRAKAQRRSAAEPQPKGPPNRRAGVGAYRRKNFLEKKQAALWR